MTEFCSGFCELNNHVTTHDYIHRILLSPRLPIMRGLQNSSKILKKKKNLIAPLITFVIRSHVLIIDRSRFRYGIFLCGTLGLDT